MTNSTVSPFGAAHTNSFSRRRDRIDERQRIFERFHRLLGNHEEGSGLGLAIVREIALAHGGQVSLRDGEGGRGLCVEVELPLGSTPTS